MNGGQHFVIGAVATGLGLWGAQAMGLQLETGAIIAGALIAGVGSLAPDIDHPRSTISRGLPTELLRAAWILLSLPITLIVLFALSGDLRSAFEVFQSWSQTSLVRWGLVLVIPAVILMVASAIISVLFEHRGTTHSLVFALGATLIATGVGMYFNAAWWYGLLFGWGWLLHLLADATTEMGLPSLLWPFADDDWRY
jgi:membrane-bound metal-dependent hydrolase YbcI (DUF457 family)